MTTRTAKIIIVSLVAAIAILVGFFLVPHRTNAQSTKRFSDVPEKHANALAIQTLKEAGVINGYGDGTFKPDSPISRAETIAIILKARGITAVKTETPLIFTDVPSDAWFYPMIQRGVAMGKIRGYPDNTFRPDRPVSLAEALALLISFNEIDTSTLTPDAKIFEGFISNEWYGRFGQYAKNNYIIEADANGYLDALALLSRAQVAELVHRMRLVQQTGRPFDVSTNWITTEHTNNFWKLRHPSTWEVFKGLKNSVIWKRASEQVFFTRLWPKSARVSISIVENPEQRTPETYFANTTSTYQKAYEKSAPVFSSITLSGRPTLRIDIEEKNLIDLYINLPNRNFLLISGEYGNDADAREQLKKEVLAVMLSYEYVAGVSGLAPLDERMIALREQILVSNGWKAVSGLFPDKKLAFTDAIGIGTGAVDYYYSKEANHTIKLERSSSTILNIREGNTHGF